MSSRPVRRIPDPVSKNTKLTQSKEIKIKSKAKHECDVKYLWVSNRDWEYYGPTFTAPTSSLKRAGAQTSQDAEV